MKRAGHIGWRDQQPLDPESSKAQVRSLLALLGPGPCRVLDLGCGSGRALAPLARAGHEVVGVDRDARCLKSCKGRLNRHRATLRRFDFLNPWPRLGPRFDAALCLGHTFMTITGLQPAASLLRRSASSLREGGRFIIDDFPQQLWPELTSGRWGDGLSADGSLEMRWEHDDNVFLLRRRRARRAADRERRFRLWTMGQLALLADCTGFSEPRWEPALPGVVVFTRRAGYRHSTSRRHFTRAR